MFNKLLLCREKVKVRYFNTKQKLLFVFTSDPFGIIEDVLDCERCEHHTYGFSWHTHLGTEWEKQYFKRNTFILHIGTYTLHMI